MSDFAALNSIQSYISTDYSSEVRDAAIDLISAINSAGIQNVANAGANAYGDALVEALTDAISARDDIPQAKKDEVIEAVEAANSGGQIDTPAEAKSLVEMMLDMIKEVAQEEVKEAVNQAGGENDESQGGAKSGGSGNWLVSLAKALGSIAGDHLKKTIEAQEKIAALEGSGGTDAEKAGAMAELQAEMQAHTQMFKMMMEATTTITKSVGEALSGAARKQ